MNSYKEHFKLQRFEDVMFHLDFSMAVNEDDMKYLGWFIQKCSTKTLSYICDKFNTVGCRDLVYSTGLIIYGNEMNVDPIELDTHGLEFKRAICTAVYDCAELEKMNREGLTDMGCSDILISDEVIEQINLNVLRYGA